MNILIVVARNVLSDDVNYKYMFPLGLAYISSVLKQAKYNVDCFNLNHYAGPVETLIHKALSQKTYDFVLTGGLSTSYNQVKMVANAVHTSGAITGLILGGGLISSEPELMFNDLKPNYIVIGEGEKTICELLKCLENKENVENVPGIGFRDKTGKFVCTKPSTPISDLDSIPYPDFEAFEFDKCLDNMQPNDQYFYDLYDYPRVYPIVCSRSCPFLCTFCFHPVGNRYRQRSIDSIINELSVMIKKYRINTIAIYDELFSNNREWLYGFCRRFKVLAKEFSWKIQWCCQMRVDKLDDEMLQIMKDAGCYMVSYGFESFSAVVLKSMKKHIGPEQIERAVEITLKNNVSVQGNFIFGDIAETTQTANETLNFWEKHPYAGIMLAFINPYPGTEIYNECLKRGIIKDKLDFIAHHIYDVFNMSETMTAAEFDKLKNDVYEAEFKYRVYAVPDFVEKQKNDTCSIHVKCPHCQEVMEYRNYWISFRLYFIFMMYCRCCRRRFFVVSGLYKLVSRVLLFLSLILPYGIKRIFYDILIKTGKLKPYIKKFIRGLK